MALHSAFLFGLHTVLNQLNVCQSASFMDSGHILLVFTDLCQACRCVYHPCSAQLALWLLYGLCTILNLKLLVVCSYFILATSSLQNAGIDPKPKF